MKKTFILLTLGLSLSMAETKIDMTKTELKSTVPTEIIVREIRVDRIARSSRAGRTSRSNREIRVARSIHYIHTKESLRLASNH